MSTFLELSLLQINLSKRNETFHEQSTWHLSFKHIWIGSLAQLTTSWLPYFTKKLEHCHGNSFDPICLKFWIWVILFIVRFKIVHVAQLSTSPTLGQNNGWKNVKTGSDLNLKTKYWFWLIFSCLSWVCVYEVYLIRNKL